MYHLYIRKRQQFGKFNFPKFKTLITRVFNASKQLYIPCYKKKKFIIIFDTTNIIEIISNFHSGFFFFSLALQNIEVWLYVHFTYLEKCFCYDFCSVYCRQYNKSHFLISTVPSKMKLRYLRYQPARY